MRTAARHVLTAVLLMVSLVGADGASLLETALAPCANSAAASDDSPCGVSACAVSVTTLPQVLEYVYGLALEAYTGTPGRSVAPLDLPPKPSLSL
jgi:hypothetical protein